MHGNEGGSCDELNLSDTSILILVCLLKQPADLLGGGNCSRNKVYNM